MAVAWDPYPRRIEYCLRKRLGINTGQGLKLWRNGLGRVS